MSGPPERRRRAALGALAGMGALLSAAGAGANPARAEVALRGALELELEGADSGEGESLWMTPTDLERLSGFELKPEGLCLDELCVPVQPEVDPALARPGPDAAAPGTLRVDAAELARRLGQAYAHDDASQVWSFGPVPTRERRWIERAQAPDFTLPDREGRPVSLSDFRGRKVVVLTWASWCLCRQDLPVWEELYRELRGRGFELIAVAEDAGGEAAAGPYLDAADPSYTTLIDRSHLVTAAYHLVNVPTAIWIDEQGTIVRLDQGAYPRPRRILGVAVGTPGYADALRDWVARGDASRVVQPPDQMSRVIARRSRDEALADQHFRIGAYFNERGDRAQATRHWERAAKLAPDNWNYTRQEWSDSFFESTVKWIGKAFGRGLLRGIPYYEPTELPEPEPPVEP